VICCIKNASFDNVIKL